MRPVLFIMGLAFGGLTMAAPVDDAKSPKPKPPAVPNACREACIEGTKWCAQSAAIEQTKNQCGPPPINDPWGSGSKLDKWNVCVDEAQKKRFASDTKCVEKYVPCVNQCAKDLGFNI